jgi:hypothetical protein
LVAGGDESLLVLFGNDFFLIGQTLSGQSALVFLRPLDFIALVFRAGVFLAAGLLWLFDFFFVIKTR